MTDVNEKFKEGREPLTDERLGEFLAGAANHEIKGIVLGAMTLGDEYTSYTLHKKVKSLLSGQLEYCPKASDVRQFCLESFIPNSLVNQREVEWRKGKKSLFWLTEEGRLAQSLDGHVLDLSSRYPHVTQRRLMGMTHSVNPDKRTPIATFMTIFDLLTSSGGLTVTELTENGLNDNRLKTIEAAGLIERAHYRHDKVYRAINTPERRQGRGGRPSKLTNLVDQYVATAVQAKDPRLTAKMIADSEIFKTEFPAGTSRADLTNIKYRLLALERQGALGVVSAEQAGVVTWIKPKYRRVAEELCEIILRFREQEPEFLVEGHQKLDTIMSRPEVVGQLIDKCIEDTPRAHWLPYAVKIEMIDEALKSFESVERPSAEQIATRVNHPFVTAISVRKALQRRRAEQAST